MRERLGLFCVDSQQGGGKLVVAFLILARHECAQVTTIRSHVLGVMHLFCRSRPSPSETGAMAAPLLELRPVTLRNSHKAENDRGGQREGQCGDEIERRGGGGGSLQT